MGWTCPQCGREFRNTNQWHSCIRTPLSDHLKSRSPAVRTIVESLIAGLEETAPITVSPVRTSIEVKAGATFLSIRPKKDHVEIEFQLGREVTEFPVYETIRISGRRVLHRGVLEDPGEVDARLMGWLMESHQLVSGERDE
jgi:hypothetical protein